MTKKIEPILFDVPMPIETPHLRLEIARAGFGSQVLEAVNESLEVLKPWMAWAHKPEDMTLDSREKWLREAEAKFIMRDCLFMMAFEKKTGRYVGGTGFHDINWDVPSLTIGYWVRQSMQGKGYATEMTVGLLHYAFKALKVSRVEITHAQGNEASRRVIEKSGFSLEGTRRHDDRCPKGDLMNTLIYSHIDIGDVPILDVRW